jgi:hypothetical protein
VLIKTGQTPERRERIFVIVGGVAQIALVASIILGRMDIDGLDFLEGMLMGFSIVGNLAYLYSTSRRKGAK